MPFSAVRRYEELLELPDGLLVSVVNAMSRYTLKDASVPPPLMPKAAEDRIRDRQRLEASIEKACSADPMTGRDTRWPGMQRTSMDQIPL